MRTQTATQYRLLGLMACSVAIQSLFGCTFHTTTTRLQVNGKAITFDGFPGGNQAQETVQQRVAADQVERLNIATTAGNIEIRQNDDSANTILIRATKYVTGSQAIRELQTYLPKVKVTQQLQNGALLVKSEVPAGTMPAGVGYYVSYVVTVPQRLAVELKTVSGDITVNGIHGGVKADTSSGGIELKAVAGRLDLQTVSGDVTVRDAPDATGITVDTSSGALELKNIAGRFAAHSVSGNVTVEGAKITDSIKADSSSGALKFTAVRAAGSSLNLDLSTVSGDIAYSGDVDKIDAHTSSGSVELDATEYMALKEVKAESVSGNLTLQLPGLKSARITAHTVSGSLDLPAAGGDPPSDSDDEDRHSATVKLGSGTTPVSLNTSSGDITLTAEHE